MKRHATTGVQHIAAADRVICEVEEMAVLGH
jgi:hypothetical protein